MLYNKKQRRQAGFPNKKKHYRHDNKRIRSPEQYAALKRDRGDFVSTCNNRGCSQGLEVLACISELLERFPPQAREVPLPRDLIVYEKDVTYVDVVIGILQIEIWFLAAVTLWLVRKNLGYVMPYISWVELHKWFTSIHEYAMSSAEITEATARLVEQLRTSLHFWMSHNHEGNMHRVLHCWHDLYRAVTSSSGARS